MQNQACSRRELGRLMSALSVLAFAGCATSSKFAQVRNSIATYALSLQNMPYVWGGRDLTTGFDCSGFVAHVYQQAASIELRGNAASMAKAARPISTDEVLAGDLLFFNTMNRPASHVGIYVGDNKFVHASNARTGVRVDRLNNRYYAERFEGAKRLLA